MKKRIMSALRAVVRKSGSARVVLRWLAGIGLLPERVWRGLPPDGRHVLRGPEGARFVYVAEPGDQLAVSIVWSGFRRWEETTIPVFCRLVRNARGFADIGAFTGIYSLLGCAINPALVVKAFEPNPNVVPWLAQNAQANRFEDRIEISPLALSDSSGAGTLAVPYDVTAALLSRSGAARDGFQVPIATLDEACAGMPIDIIKIDVNGHDHAVLRGGLTLIGQRKPHIIVECLDEEDFRRVKATLEPIGYEFFYHLSRRGPLRVFDSGQPRPRYPNFLCSTAAL